MTQPLALLLYEKLLPGSQLANRLRDTGWRVEIISAGADLVAAATALTPLLVFADLLATRGSVTEAIAALRADAATAHIPVIAFTAENEQAVLDAAIESGATLVASDTALLQHLEQFVDQALNEF
jgi:CheY-like chemotaxis protein